MHLQIAGLGLGEEAEGVQAVADVQGQAVRVQVGEVARGRRGVDGDESQVVDRELGTLRVDGLAQVVGGQGRARVDGEFDDGAAGRDADEPLRLGGRPRGAVGDGKDLPALHPAGQPDGERMHVPAADRVDHFRRPCVETGRLRRQGRAVDGADGRAGRAPAEDGLAGEGRPPDDLGVGEPDGAGRPDRAAAVGVVLRRHALLPDRQAEGALCGREQLVGRLLVAGEGRGHALSVQCLRGPHPVAELAERGRRGRRLLAGAIGVPGLQQGRREVEAGAGHRVRRSALCLRTFERLLHRGGGQLGLPVGHQGERLGGDHLEEVVAGRGLAEAGGRVGGELVLQGGRGEGGQAARFGRLGAAASSSAHRQ